VNVSMAAFAARRATRRRGNLILPH
jgi:hypothetical protein